jgi:Subtilisin inhibitor-like
VLALAPLFAALAVGASGSTETTALRVVVWPEGPDRGGARSWVLRCGPAGGTLPRPAAACRQLAAVQQPFAPVPDYIACVEIYGGPQVARVVGTFRGRRVWATFRRTDGCEIARWNRVRLLFPVATGPT